jgi:hypothetical protein
MNGEKIHIWMEEIIACLEGICTDRIKKITENELTTSRVEKGTSRVKLLRLDYLVLRWIICRTQVGTTWKIYCHKYPCGGGVEYLHRDPASRKRRRKGKSQIWDSKIWSQLPRDSDPKKTALARASSMYKRQTRPLVREGALRNKERNCQTYSVFRTEEKSGRKPQMGALYQDRLADWPSVVT